MKHKHIGTRYKDWDSRNYQCVCGFKTGDLSKFDKHLKDNKKLQVDGCKCKYQKYWEEQKANFCGACGGSLIQRLEG